MPPHRPLHELINDLWRRGNGLPPSEREVPDVSDAQIIDLVRFMRSAQRRYFQTRDGGDLSAARDWERRVDEALSGRGQPSLFDSLPPEET